MPRHALCKQVEGNQVRGCVIGRPLRIFAHFPRLEPSLKFRGVEGANLEEITSPSFDPPICSACKSPELRTQNQLSETWPFDVVTSISCSAALRCCQYAGRVKGGSLTGVMPIASFTRFKAPMVMFEEETITPRRFDQSVFASTVLKAFEIPLPGN